jgi:serine/threonine-protein kinase
VADEIESKQSQDDAPAPVFGAKTEEADDKSEAADSLESDSPIKETPITKSKRYACSTCGEEYSDIADQKCPFDGTRLTPIAEEIAPGSVLADRFVIVEAMSGGAMGKVYKAHHKLMKRSVAIKTLLPQLVASGAALKRFQQEAQALSALSHPNVLSVFDFFIGEDGQPYLVMDFLEGTNLEQVREKQGALPIERAVHIFSQVCDGMSAAHEAGILHRDLKPSNIMLVRANKDSDFVKVIDFGIAKLAPSETGGALTATGDVFGTPQFMSPEQCRGKVPDARSDIYSFGCVMYTMLTNTLPFTADDSMQLMYKHVNEAPPPFPAESAVSRVLQSIVLKAMAKNPDERWQSMDELKDAMLVAAPHAVSHSSGTGMAAKAPKDWKLEVAIALVLLTVAVTAFISWLTHNQMQPTPRPTTQEPITAAPPATTLNEIPQNSNSAQSQQNLQLPPAQSSPQQMTQQQIAQQELFQQNPSQSQNSSTPNYARRQQRNPAAPQYQRRVDDPSSDFQAYLNQGEVLYKQGNFHAAQQYFNAAHRLAGGFGESDPRYTESLEWQGKVAFRTGNYALAKQAMEFVLYALKARGDQRSARYKEAEHELDAILAALRTKDKDHNGFAD